MDYNYDHIEINKTDYMYNKFLFITPSNGPTTFLFLNRYLSENL